MLLLELVGISLIFIIINSIIDINFSDSVDGVRDLVAQVSQLALNPTSNNDLCTLNSDPTTSLVGGGGASATPMATTTTTTMTMTTTKQKTGGGFLPQIPSGHKPISLTARAPAHGGRGKVESIIRTSVCTRSNSP